MTELDIPERAIDTFERIHQLNITVHDLTGNLSPFLKSHRFHHRSPLCLAVKAQGHVATCLQFELQSLRRDLAARTAGRMHVCHAGLVEWVVPIFDKEKLSWVLFAGPRLPAKGLSTEVQSRPTPWLKSPWTRKTVMPRFVEEEEGQLILEHLRQLAARLQKWAEDLKSRRVTQTSSGHFPSDVWTTRQTAVLRFIEGNHARPVTLSLLAEILGLSESRTSHVVQQCCGTNFRELLVQKRLATAMQLLLQSSMSVLQVALASGFEDVAHFHRLFRRRIGTTPARYRLSGRS